MWLVILVLAFLLADLLPLGDIISVATNFQLSEYLGLNNYGTYTTVKFAISFAVAVVLSRAFVLRSVRSGVMQPQRARKPLLVGIGLIAAFFALAPFSVVLSAIPYGGGKVPHALYMLLYFAKCLAVWGIAKSLLPIGEPNPSVERTPNGAAHVKR